MLPLLYEVKRPGQFPQAMQEERPSPPSLPPGPTALELRLRTEQLNLISREEWAPEYPGTSWVCLAWL